MLPKGTLLRIRTVGKIERIVKPHDRQIFGYHVESPVQPSLTVVNSYVQDPSAIYLSRAKAFTSGDKLRVPHGLLKWPPLAEGEESVCLDMTALSFGQAGHSRDKCLFTLDTQSEHESLLRRCGETLGMDQPGTVWQDLSGDSQYMVWAEEVVHRVLKRWTSTNKLLPYCGYCGAPQEQDVKCCPCKEVHYCSQAHQAKHWKYHKVWCTRKKEKKEA